MAHQLAHAGQSVELLALIDSPAPWSIRDFFRSDAEILAYLMARGGDPQQHFRRIASLSEEDMLRDFLLRGGAEERLGPAATAASVRHFLQLFRANFNALTRYRPRPYSGTGLFFHATEHDAYNTSGYAEAWRPYFERLEVVAAPGNHTTMNLPPNCDVIVVRVQAEFGARALSALSMR